MSRKRNQISYHKPDPPFLQRIRQQIGYQPGPDIDTKRESLSQTDENDLNDKSDEKPTVVITDNSNLSKKEQEDFAEKLNEVRPVKILFKKPNNKSTSGLKRPLDKKKSNEEDISKKLKHQNNRLLSFDEEF